MSVVYSAECKAVQKSQGSVRLLPVLVVLFIFSYAILTTLVMEQGRTIESQRSLIHEMLRDSTQLAELKGQIARDESMRSRAKVAAPSAQQESNTPPAPKSPDHDAKRGGKSARATKVPGRPQADLEDVRRITRTL